MMTHCVQCRQKKYGPGNGFCFDCHNMFVMVKKMQNRARLAARKGK